MVKGKSSISQFVTLLAVFLGGGFAGAWLSTQAAPNSGLAAAVSVMMLPGTLFFGFFGWLGFAILSLPVLIVKKLFGKLPVLDKQEAHIPPGSFVFVIVSVIICGCAGTISGFASESWGVAKTVSVYLVVGVTYGTTLWKLAAFGYLPFPEE